MNRRELLIGTASAAAIAFVAAPVLISSAEAAAIYGDPDVQFRDFVVEGVPASGLYHPLRTDGDLWFSRLGLPNTRSNSWRRTDWRLLSKARVREQCWKWIDAARHGMPYSCTVEDVLV